VTPAELSPELLRAAILRHGFLLVRGLVDTDQAGSFRQEMDRAFAAREEGGDADGDGYFEKFVPDPRYEGLPRAAVSGPMAMWVADSPRLAAELFDIFEGAGLLRLVTGYLGEHPAASVNKSTLRRVKHNPEVKLPVSFWHQDGAFLGDVRAINVWLSLSRCGDLAPGLDLVPTRIDHVLPTGTEGAFFDWSVSQTVAEEAAGEAGISRPIFEPGDALLFDELSLHATASSPEMLDARYAIECWFFGPSAYPAEYPPLAS
jgi:Phytanoyl-CoA dioxygenase (PhyH)